MRRTMDTPCDAAALSQKLSRVHSDVDETVCHVGQRMRVLGWMLLSAEDSTSSPPCNHAMSTAIDIAAELLGTWAARLDHLSESIRDRPSHRPSDGGAT